MPWKNSPSAPSRTNRRRSAGAGLLKPNARATSSAKNNFWQGVTQKLSPRRKNRLNIAKASSPKNNFYQANAPQNLVPKLTKRLLGLIILILLLTSLIGIISFNFKLNSLIFPGRQANPNLKEWDGNQNLTVALFGVDTKDDQLQFIDSLQLLYIQPRATTVTVLAVDPELAVDIKELTPGSLAKEVKTVYTFKQLYNYYLAELNDPQRALQEFTNHLEAELGIHIDRYIFLEKANFTQVMQPFSSVLFNLSSPLVDTSLAVNYPKGANWYGLTEQLNILAVKSESAKNSDFKLQRQSEMIKRYILDLAQPVPSAKVAILLLSNPNLTKLLDTNFSGSEFWKLYGFARKLTDYKIETAVTLESQSYIKENQRYLDKKAFDERVRKLYRNQDVLVEQVRLDVINSTSRSGLAGKYKRLLANYSFNVVRTANTSKVHTHNTLYTATPEKYPATIRQLQQFFPDLVIVQQDYPDRPTGDIVLVVI